jgi:hypothetical protein
MKDIGELPVVGFHYRRKLVVMIRKGEAMTACSREHIKRRL